MIYNDKADVLIDGDDDVIYHADSVIYHDKDQLGSVNN